MKQFIFSIFLLSLIINSSQAQRGWRSFDQFGWITQIHQTTNHSLWLVGINGIWHLNHGGWQQVPHASAFVFEDNAGAIWVAGPKSEGLWRYDTDGWQQETQVTGIVNSIYQQEDGTLWVGGLDVVWRYDQSGWQQLAGFTGLVRSIHRSSDGALWLGTEDTDTPWWILFKPPQVKGGLWRYDNAGWHQLPQFTTRVETLYESKDGTTIQGSEV